MTPTSSTFNFTVTTTNEPPIASPVTLAAIAEDSGGRLITQAELLAAVIDPDGPSLTITALSIAGGSGTLVDNGDGTWTYTPALNDDTAVASTTRSSTVSRAHPRRRASTSRRWMMHRMPVQ